MLQITISHDSIFLCCRPTLYGRCRLTAVHRNLSDEARKGTSDGSRGSPGVSKRWLNALTMAGSHGSAEAPNTSAASIKSASQTVLGSALGTERPIKIPVSASDTRRKHEPWRCWCWKRHPLPRLSRSSGKTATVANHRSERTKLQPCCATSLRNG